MDPFLISILKYALLYIMLLCHSLTHLFSLCITITINTDSVECTIVQKQPYTVMNTVNYIVGKAQRFGDLATVVGRLKSQAIASWQSP